MVFDLLRRESVREAREVAHLHTHREILSLDETRGNVFDLGISMNQPVPIPIILAVTDESR